MQDDLIRLYNFSLMIDTSEPVSKTAVVLIPCTVTGRIGALNSEPNVGTGGFDIKLSVVASANIRETVLERTLW